MSVQILSDVLSIGAAINALAERQPATAFLIGPDAEFPVTFQDLKNGSVLLCRMLHQAGLRKGDKVAFLMDNGLLTAQLFLGSMYGGYVAVPLNVRAGAMQLSYTLDHCDAAIVFVEPQYQDLLRESLQGNGRFIRVVTADADGPMPAFEQPAAIDLDPPCATAVALLMYSSGSTGKPKAAVHTHRSILAHGRNSIEAHRLSQADRSLLVLPLYHINAECVTLIPTLLSGGSVVIVRRFAVSKFWDWVDDLRITWAALVPTIISELVEWDDPKKHERDAAFARIRFLRSSSAPLSSALHQRFLDKFRLPLLQAMGSTECGNVFSNPVPPAANKIGSPGLPWGFASRIVDREGADVQRGESGEVLLRGPGLMSGYYKDPEGTAAVVDADGWLHTGDLARQDEDGYFFVVGRSKELIIKGGVNIAPRQIDEVLESHPAVLEAAAVGVPERYFGEDAVAFVVLRSDAAADEKELLAYCETRLGHFKAPSRIHFLKELPKGPSGKVQRLRLLDPEVLAAVAATAQPESYPVTINAHGDGSDPTSAGSSIEQIVSSAWAEVLALPEVDPQTNFFALGGHSLLAIQCISKLRDRLPMVLSLADFFEFSTVAEQAELVRKRLHPANGNGSQELADQSTNWEQSLLEQYVPPPSEEIIPRQDPSLPHPLSPAQQGLWFLEELNPNVPVYNEAEAVRLTGELNVDALETAMNMVIDRQEVLRSTIKVIDEAPHAVIHKSRPLRFKKIDLSALPTADREAEVERLLISEPQAPYRLEEKPGIRVTLLHLAPREHVLILMMHHIVCDWASEGAIWRDLSAIYRSLLTRQPAVLAELTISHGDYAVWQHRRLGSTSFSDDLAYWEETLKGAPALLELPADRPRPPVMSYRGDRVRWKLNNTLTEALRNTSRTEKTSLFTIFAAALDTLLYRYTGSDDILLGIPLADRDHPGLEAVVGYLLRMHVLRTRLSGEMTFRDLLSLVQKGTLDLYLHRTVPFDQVVHKLQPERNPGYTPVFQVALNWRDRDQMLPFIGLEGLAIDSLMATAGTTKFDLLFQATDIGNEIWLELEFNTDIFDRDRMSRMLGHYQTFLESVANDPGAKLAEMPLLTAAELRQVVFDWNDTAADYPRDVSLAKLVEEQVERAPDVAAVILEDGSSITYRGLNEKANQLAHELRKYGAGPDQLVGMCVERSVNMILALLAIVKAGAAYVPIDPDLPLERLGYMIEDSGLRILVTQKALRSSLPPFAGAVIEVDSDVSENNSRENPNVRVSPDNLAHIIYTSGSTGRPKGVQVPRSALTNLLWCMRELLQLKNTDTLLAVTTISFDIAGVDVWLPLLTGARSVIASRTSALDGQRLLEMIERHHVTFLQATPTTWRLLLAAGLRDKHQLTTVCTGEAMPRELAAQLRPEVARLWNLYGPTETTIWSTAWRVEKGDEPVLIGRPVANTQCYLLDGGGQPVPIGVAGELYIAGDGLARGYRNLPKLTDEKFIPNPFTSGSRMYRTGDLARYRADGNLECLGRNDFQVKIRGFRIELGEIEAVLGEQHGIAQCAVLVQAGDQADKRLVAYIVPTDPQVVPAVDDLRSALKQRLPSYMIPAAFAVVERMPLTPNGKIDRKALSQSNLTTIASEAPVDVPRDSVEARLVQIWEQVLDLHPIGIRTNFFEVGGYSLMVAKLFTQINKVFGRSLPIATIFSAPTIEQLAALLREKTTSATLVPIRPSGSKEPLFIVHSYLIYERIRQVIDPDRPLYGLHEREDDGERVFSVRDRVSEYLNHIREVQPQGPYHLVGWCAAGPLVVELARSLRECGAEVGLLGLIDAASPEYTAQLRSDRARKSFADRARGWMRYHRQVRSRSARTGTVRYFARYLRNLVTDKIRGLMIRHHTFVLAFCRRMGIPSPAFLLNLSTWKVEHSAPYDGAITLFQPLETHHIRHDATLGWGGVASGGVHVVQTPGDHETMFRQGNVEVFGQRLQEILEDYSPAKPVPSPLEPDASHGLAHVGGSR
jgi:amino acid adenylation domain-containing protein